ncbi:uncharacterized protein si:ch211-191i18.2 isoform X1 [Acanthopagrus latus]|uniref:uncharacterized protein si:ch211-191i18.2 isoform X1 n=1 Tax=Acanthopagrus latus TaxID=8177 RepID=UPI00187BCB2A|nr:uncharacterized protein si:ch211-191i18.2 isoform X1 [Acanthopagrus latus]
MSLSFLSVYLSGASLILLLPAVCQVQYDDFTPAPDYDLDYNATFEYSFFSNASSEDLDKFSERFVDQENGGEDDMGGQQEDEDVTVTMTTSGQTTERGKVGVRSAASLPVSLDIRTLLWTLLILISLNTQQLLRTL